MNTYTWVVESVELGAGTMVVQYLRDDQTVRQNIPMPPVSEDVDAWIQSFAPAWKAQAQFAPVEVGRTGSGVLQVQPVPDQVNYLGSWNDEYLRAMIYQVLEEIKETTV